MALQTKNNDYPPLPPLSDKVFNRIKKEGGIAHSNKKYTYIYNNREKRGAKGGAHKNSNKNINKIDYSFFFFKCHIPDKKGREIIRDNEPAYLICRVKASTIETAKNMIKKSGYKPAKFLGPDQLRSEIRSRQGRPIKNLPDGSCDLWFAG